MPYLMNVPEIDVFERGKYKNVHGVTECVEFVRKVSAAPQTITWRRGLRVKSAAPGTIARGTVIATFDDSGHYPSDALGKHAAIYITHDAHRIDVLDQWAEKGAVTRRPIAFNQPDNTRRSNNGDTYYVVE